MIKNLFFVSALLAFLSITPALVVGVEPVKVCPEGTTWSPEDKACVSPPICPQGGAYNPQTKRCEATPQYDCPEGWTLDEKARVCYKKRADVEKKDICALSESLIHKHTEAPQFTVEKKNLVSNELCEVIAKVQTEYVTLYVSENFVILGTLFSNRTTPAFTAIEEMRKRDFTASKGKLDELVAFSYGKGETLYFITDPECFHCEKAKVAVKELSDKHNIEVKAIVYPISQRTKGKAVKAYCGQMSYNDYLNNKYPAKECKTGEDKVSNIISFLTSLGIQGTPTFIASSGEKVVGFQAERILQSLKVLN